MTSDNENNTNKNDPKKRQTSVDEAFKRGGKVSRSPKTDETPKVTGAKGRNKELEEAWNDEMDEITPMDKAINAVKDLKIFVDSKNNIHSEVKSLLLKAMKAMNSMKREWDKMRKDLDQARAEQQNVKPVNPILETPKIDNTKKRRRISPETPKAELPRETHNVENKWQTVRTKTKTKERKQQPEGPKDKPKPKARRHKPDAIAIEIKDGKTEMTYSDVLKKIKSDPKLKELGEQVARIRKTRKGEMLIEFRTDTAAKSTTYKEMVEKTVGEVATVKTLTQEVVVECLNMDEVTTEDDFRTALKTQLELEDGQCEGPIRMRKAYGATQIGSIKVALPVANKILEKGKLKVGWSICPLRVPQQPLRCYKCMSFGHQSKNCQGADRSKACWRCGVDGHQAKDCKGEPKCLLCTDEGSNKHATGSFSCKAYKEAVGKQGWK